MSRITYVIESIEDGTPHFSTDDKKHAKKVFKGLEKRFPDVFSLFRLIECKMQ